MRVRSIPCLAFAAALAMAGNARADEIRLRDGTTIQGTIVGYQDDSFKVEMPYGFALIRKDKVAGIVPSADPVKANAAANAPATASSTAPPAKKAAPTRVREQPPAAKPASPPSAAATVAMNPPAAAVTSSAAKASPAKAETAAASPAAPSPRLPAAAPAAAPRAAPVTPPEPVVIRDEVRGTSYINHTYGFQMYKPPSWSLIPEARGAMPDAVAALGTGDQDTLLVVGRRASSSSLDAEVDLTEKKLRDIYENYRAVSGRRTTVAGVSAVERRFRGAANGHDWSVILLSFQRGANLFTLLGMTRADTDLVQVQENVIARTVRSLTFENAVSDATR